MTLPDPLVSPIEPAFAAFLAQAATQPPMESLPPAVVRGLIRQMSTVPGPPA